MISPETTDDILSEIARALHRIADNTAPIIKPTIDDDNPWHDQGNGTNHRISQCSLKYCGQEPTPVVCTWIDSRYSLDQSADGLLKRIEDYRTGYSTGYADGKNGTRMRDKDAACLFFSITGIPDMTRD